VPKDWDTLEETVEKAPGKAPLGSPSIEQIDNAINKACIQKCGKAPTNSSECAGYNEHLVPRYKCKIRLISDNINFAQEMGWYILVTSYYRELLEVIEGDKDSTSST